MRWVILGLIVAASPAFADDIQAADQKFDEATKLREQGKTKEACEAFDASLALNPNAIGTILNVARCHAEAGKIATAIHDFTDARERAREANLTPQLTAAEEYLAKLEPRVPHLRVTFAEPYADGKLLVAGKVIDFSVANDVLVDPGEVEVVVSAPGRTTYKQTVHVDEAQHQTIAIPKLGFPVTVCAACRPIGKVAVGVGAVAGVTGLVLMFVAHHKYYQALNGVSGTNPNCASHSPTPVCDQATVNSLGDDITLFNVGGATALAGLAIGLGGAALWYFTPSSHGDRERMTIMPVVSPSEAGIAALGRF
ncbi:MAG: hypothetical protein QM831_30585 [Kofleriaceae bacterium]